MRLLPGSYQECLGCVSLERTVGGGLLLGVRVKYCDGKPIPRRLCWDGDRSGTVDGGEGCGMEGLGGHLGWGGVSAPADFIGGHPEVPPEVVGLRAARPPGYRDGVSGGGG